MVFASIFPWLSILPCRSLITILASWSNPLISIVAFSCAGFGYRLTCNAPAISSAKLDKVKVSTAPYAVPASFVMYAR